MVVQGLFRDREIDMSKLSTQEMWKYSVTRGRDSVVYHLHRAHKDPLCILAGASTPARCATSWARGKFLVVRQRSLDAATLGTIQTMDKANRAGFVHGNAPMHR